jgi:MFS family permease
MTPPALRGAAFGLRQSLDTVGAFAGPLIGVGLMVLWSNDFRSIFWVATIPAWLAVAVLALGVKEAPAQTATPRTNPIRRANLARLGPAFWWVAGVGAVVTMARFSEAFLVLRAAQTGLPLAWVPLVMVAMNLVYAAAAYPFGRLSDRMSHRKLLAMGMVVLVAADGVLATDFGLASLFVGVALWGVHMAMTQGLLAAMVADTAPSDLRGTAFGVFNLASGLVMLLASVVAGLLWDRFGAGATFLAGGVFGTLALLGLAFRTPVTPTR